MAVNTIVSNGSPSNRIDIVFLGDGYTSSQLSTDYTTHANALVQYLFNGSQLTQPFGQYASYFNVHLVDVVSAQSGADNPGTGTFVDTALGSTYYFDGVTERLLSVDNSLADAKLNAALLGTGISADMKFVTVNSTKYGGAGGSYAVYAGGNGSALEVAVHEVGHSFAGLADEYGGTASTYTGSEPSEVNVTTDPSGAKWARWLGYEEAGIGMIGAYEGGRYFDQGIYRPSQASKMNVLDNPFDAVSREAFVLEFYKHVDPLDDYDYKGQTGPLVDISALSVTPIDPAIIKVDWFVNGALTLSGTTTATMTDLGLGAGTYTVSAKAYDPTDWVRSDRSDLEQTVNWTVQLSTGDAGNNTFVSTAEDDTFNGQGGLDTVTFAADRGSASVQLNGAVLTTSVAGFGTDVLTDIERLAFNDGTLAFDLTGNAGQVYRLYQAAFGRTPDTVGLSSNINLVDNGMSLHDMANAFAISSEFQSLFGANSTDAEYVNALYNNVLGRDADAAGLAGWLNALATGSDRGHVLTGFSESKENIEIVAPAIDDGIWLV